jgi:hypothetical protein
MASREKGVSSAVGFLALFGVSVETGVIMIEFINQLRSRRKGMEASTHEHIVEAADYSPGAPGLDSETWEPAQLNRPKMPFAFPDP